ncbi:MAG TPA: serine/threonine-protein kinase, partial [Gemmatimonadaceae bacterium]
MSELTASSDPSELIAALTGQYQIEREIGRGGMGIVYLARDLRLDRPVAIKTLPEQMARDATTRERFLREARTAARLSHPNIVPVYRADEIGDQVFFVMGFVDGMSLAERLAAGPMAPRELVPILRDVAAGLGYAHQHGVVHRDVKTENILLDGRTGRAMMTDFGIARLAEAAPVTATGQILGTVYYLSPEQIGGEDVDARSDIYAMGVVGYRALAGRFPFDASLASAVLVSHVTKQPAPLATVAPQVPASLASIVDRCLAKDPAHRYQTCAELDAALASAAADTNRVAVASSSSPLLSDAEAQALFERAATLQEAPEELRTPIAPMPRDRQQDAARTSGFKTVDLRSAAAEAGIDEQFMQRALAERGLRPVEATRNRADRRVSNIIHDLTKRPTLFGGNPTELIYEIVIEGEVPEEDYDLIVDAIRVRTEPDGISGRAASVGRNLTWSGRSNRRRTIDVSVSPRGGRTTIRVHESLAQIKRMLGGLGGALGAGLGAAIFGGLMSSGANAGGALTMWALVTGLGMLVGRVSKDD